MNQLNLLDNRDINKNYKVYLSFSFINASLWPRVELRSNIPGLFGRLLAFERGK